MAVGIAETGVYFPPEIETARDLSEKTGLPEDVILHKFGLRQKHVSDSSIHASDMAIFAGRSILEKIDPLDIDVIIYFGSPHKDYPVWSCAPKIQHELGAKNAYAFEMMNVSSCFPIALKVAKDMIVADHSIKSILLVGGCKESQIIDYNNERSRFMFNFADGGAAALVKRGIEKNRILGSSILTDGSFYDDVKVPAGGSVNPANTETVQNRLHYIDVKNPLDMKERLDPVSIPNFVSVVKKAVENSGYSLNDIDFLLPLHTKKSMFLQLLEQLGLREEQAIYLDEYGHMSALDPCIGLHFAEQQGMLKKGDLIVAVSAGTGYTWAATVIQWNV
ncbi:3-oxoacyl-ACP synthase [Microaerobacter geothermalis]|uniref:3-oxoacyl-ACP synthase n=1 Tax=Microaerobacter geothermalis TaxID=674972 RepID=UPI001F1AB4A2|nr:3-oxoacyl-ACP synthase [Microaerobacter geothermalis]MCF6092810.1 3-oxoacyl-ACP synthase [Microaerobacter geothermalis]